MRVRVCDRLDDRVVGLFDVVLFFEVRGSTGEYGVSCFLNFSLLECRMLFLNLNFLFF